MANTKSELDTYIEALRGLYPPTNYIPRKFTATSETGELSLEEYRFRGSLREREPGLREILNHSCLFILAEPGGGKTVITEAAVRETIGLGRVPILIQLKEFRGSLHQLLQKVPEALLEAPSEIQRTYIMDGTDELPVEWITKFSDEVIGLLAHDSAAHLVITSRQAFYVAHRDHLKLPSPTAIFHLLDLDNADIRQYATDCGLRVEEFWSALDSVDAIDEARNPFILRILADRFHSDRTLDDRRSGNLEFVINRLLDSRPRVNARTLRRALRQLAIALEIYSRNELTEDEALRVIKTSKQIGAAEPSEILRELYHSILKRTANGLTFQMRSYGEYLAAEELERASFDQVRELAFVNSTPNDSWSNTISYLAEINDEVRRYFVADKPFWMLGSSPAAFSEDERTSLATNILRLLTTDRQYVYHEPRLSVQQLARFITASVQRRLEGDLSSEVAVVRGNALIILGILKHPNAAAVGLMILNAETGDIQLERCAISALINAGNSSQVPALVALLNETKPIYAKLIDAVGTLVEEVKLGDFLQQIFSVQGTLASTYYRFQELRSREALRAFLLYFIVRPEQLNAIGVAGYVKAIFNRLSKLFNLEIAELCAELLESIRENTVYPDHSDAFQILIQNIRQADLNGDVARFYYARLLERGNGSRDWFYVDKAVGYIMTMETAAWLVQEKAWTVIKAVSPYVSGAVREYFRPHSSGLIDKQDDHAHAYAITRVADEEKRKAHLREIQDRIVGRSVLREALNDFYSLRKEDWPDLPIDFRSWLADEIDSLMLQLNLGQTIWWNGSLLSTTRELSMCLALIERYELKLTNDVPMACTVISDDHVASKYYERFGFSAAAQGLVEQLLRSSTTSARHYVLRFIERSRFWSDPTELELRTLAIQHSAGYDVRSIALGILSSHEVEEAYFTPLLDDPDLGIARQARVILVDRQHRPTIERCLSQLLNDESCLLASESELPYDSPISWVGKIKSKFAWDKLAALRSIALKLELDRVTQLFTGILASLDRLRVASLIRSQLDLTPPSWRYFYQGQAVEQELLGRLEEAQRTPFDYVIEKLRSSTSSGRVKLVCEGPTDVDVYKALLKQIDDVPEVILDFVGGWGNLSYKDPSNLLRDVRDVFIVLDGDNGRDFSTQCRELTSFAETELQRLNAAGVQVRVLQRYGIENYFCRAAVEAVLGAQVASSFPIPVNANVSEHLRKLGASYSKSQNGAIARHLDLKRDLAGTDLYEVIHEIAARARDFYSER